MIEASRFIFLLLEMVEVLLHSLFFSLSVSHTNLLGLFQVHNCIFAVLKAKMFLRRLELLGNRIVTQLVQLNHT